MYLKLNLAFYCLKLCMELAVLHVFETQHSYRAATPVIKQLMRTILTELNLFDPEFELHTYLCDVGYTFL